MTPTPIDRWHVDVKLHGRFYGKRCLVDAGKLGQAPPRTDSLQDSLEGAAYLSECLVGGDFDRHALFNLRHADLMDLLGQLDKATREDARRRGR